MKRALAVLLLLVAVPAAAYEIDPPNPIGEFGAGRLQQPTGVAVAADGSVFVVNAAAARIEKYSKAGTHAGGWGGPGSEDGRFTVPYAVAVAPDGSVYVLDSSADRVQHFSPNGAYLGKFGSPGVGNGQLGAARGIAVDPDGIVYVADTFNHRVQKFAPAGTFLGKWGSEGAGDGQFEYPYGIAIDFKGDVYVADTQNHRVQQFTSTGVFVRKWGAQGRGDGAFDDPTGIAVDGGLNVYVVDMTSQRVQRFTATGRLLTVWGSPGTGAGQFSAPLGVGAAPNGDAYVVDSGNDRVQVFRRRNAQGHASLGAFGTYGIDDGQFVDPHGVAVSRDGFVYVVDRIAGRIEKFTLDGQWVLTWGSLGTGFGQFQQASGVAVDTSGFVYVTDLEGRRAQKFTPNGTYVRQFWAPGAFRMWDIAIDDSNRVYASDGNLIERFTSDGDFIWQNGAPHVAGIGVDHEGYIYAACTTDHVVRKFNSIGLQVASWGSFGTNPGQFDTPTDVVCDSEYVYVCDRNGRVQQFTPLGGYVEEWGTTGTGLNEIGGAQCMAVDPKGNLYVTELDNARVQRFASPPQLVRIADVPGDDGGFVQVTFTRSSAEGTGLLSTYRVVRVGINPPIGAIVALIPDGGPTTVTVPIVNNANDSFSGLREFQVQGLLSVPNGVSLISDLKGFAVDDLAPPVPSPFTAVYQGGATWLHWGVNPAPDLAEYRLSRGIAPVLIHASPDTGYADVGDAGGVYTLVAADTNGHVSAPAVIGPQETVDTPAAGLAFALAGAVPNPAHGGALLLRCTLPDAQPARLELVNVAGRSVWSRTVRGAGGHAVRAGDGLAAGIYFVRLTQDGRSLVTRAVVLD